MERFNFSIAQTPGEFEAGKALLRSMQLHLILILGSRDFSMN